MNDQELFALAAKAEALATDINARIDNPDYVFGGSAESCVAQLNDLSAQCRAVHLRAAAQRLEQLAREVKQRSGN